MPITLRELPINQLPSHAAFLPARLFRRVKAWAMGLLTRGTKRRLAGVYRSRGGRTILVYPGKTGRMMFTYQDGRPGLSSTGEIEQCIRDGSLLRLEGPLPH